MKIEKLYKLTLNYDYTENDKMVFKYAFDMLFDIGLERNKAETIKFIQAIIDEGYFNRQELYKERSRKMDMSFAYNLNLARKRCGFTQTDMSKNCILTEQHIRSGKQQNPNRALII